MKQGGYFMSLFSDHKLENNGEKYTIILYLDRSSTEFSGELGCIIDESNDQLHSMLQSYIKSNFPDKNISSAKIMLGSIRLAVIPI